MRQTTCFFSLLFLLMLGNSTLYGQDKTPTQKYWVFFKDKGTSTQKAAAEILSPKALERRARQGLKIDQRDYPLNPDYVAELKALGFKIENRSRWFNAVTVRATRAQMAQLNQQPMVRRTAPVTQFTVEVPDIDDTPIYKTEYEAGFTDHQLGMVGLTTLHRYGFTGTGVTIGVLDNGFRNVDVNPAFAHLRNEGRIMATWDFVHNEENVYNQGNHGAWVLSIMGGFLPQNFTGAAPGANFILLQTEDDGFEGHVEEDNWVAGAELADSLGADILSTSLGYSDGMQDTIFLANGDTIVDWEYKHLDGNTTIITRGADIAASRGMLVVNSAGNSGFNHVTAPSDGDSVLAVGAVDSMEVIGGFSSRGPTFDNRIKPDLSCMGVQDYFVTTTGNISQGNGTSFSCPIMAGLAACLLQSDQSVASMELFEILKQSADRFTSPDNDYGYGIPDGLKAFELINGYALSSPTIIQLTEEAGMVVYPNPFNEYFDLLIDSEDSTYQAEVEMISVDPAGRTNYKFSEEITVRPLINKYRFDRETYFPGFANGIYSFRIRRADSKEAIFTRKIVLDK